MQNFMIFPFITFSHTTNQLKRTKSSLNQNTKFFHGIPYFAYSNFTLKSYTHLISRTPGFLMQSFFHGLTLSRQGDSYPFPDRAIALSRQGDRSYTHLSQTFLAGSGQKTLKTVFLQGKTNGYTKF